MKNLIHLLVITALLFVVPFAVAAEKPATRAQAAAAAQKAVNCCIKGKCQKAATVKQCQQMGGKAVKVCKQCK
jgi:hypothetical protein